jgi:hypothetical protein
METQVTCACGRKIKAISLKQHEKTRIHQVGLEIAKAIAKKTAAEKEREAAKEKQWVSEVLNNIAQTKREIKAATTIQWWWRKVSANPANHVGYRRMLKLFEEL